MPTESTPSEVGRFPLRLLNTTIALTLVTIGAISWNSSSNLANAHRWAERYLAAFVEAAYRWTLRSR